MAINRNLEFFFEIKRLLTEKRFRHSLNVAYEAMKLAEKYGADAEKAFTAGLLHDIMKDTSFNRQLEIILKSGISLTETELKSPKIWHQISGAVYIRDFLNLKDEDIISAVRYHTTGKANMTLLQKCVYIGDYISADRNYDGVDELRKKAYINLDEVLLVGEQFTILDNVGKKRPISEDSINAYNYLLANLGDEK